MPLKNDADRWGWISLGIHWLTVAMVLGLGVGGKQREALRVRAGS